MNIPENTTLYNLAILPSDEVAQQAIQFSNDLQSFGGEFVLTDTFPLPHMTVCMARYPEANIDELTLELTHLLKNFKPFTATSTGYFQTPGAYIEGSYEKNEALMQLHLAIVEACSAFRYRSDQPFREYYYGPFDEEQQRNVIQFGYDLVGKRYRPHVTFTKLAEKNDAAVASLPANDLSFQVIRLGLFEADQFGAAQRLIKEFHLSE